MFFNALMNVPIWQIEKSFLCESHDYFLQLDQVNQSALLSQSSSNDANLTEMEQNFLSSIKDQKVYFKGDEIPFYALARKVFVSEESFFPASANNSSTSNGSFSSPGKSFLCKSHIFFNFMTH